MVNPPPACFALLAAVSDLLYAIAEVNYLTQ